MSENPYRQRILDHARAPHGRGPLSPCDAEETCHNPLCGDRVTLRVRLDGTRVDEARFEARGCAISIASASILCNHVTGMTSDDARQLAASVVAAVREGADRSDFDADLRALAEIHAARARRRCATLAWEALSKALS